MLVLSRKIDEKILIGEEVTITVLGIRGGQIRLGIEAPTSVPIIREELVRHARPRGFDPSSERELHSLLRNRLTDRLEPAIFPELLTSSSRGD